MSLFQSSEKKNRSGPIAPTAVNFSHFCITVAAGLRVVAR